MPALLDHTNNWLEEEFMIEIGMQRETQAVLEQQICLL